MNLETIMRKELVRYLVQKHIFCPFGGQVLDVDTCVVVLDADGDPCTVMHPDTYRALIKIAADGGVNPIRSPFHFDTATLPE